MRNYEKDKVKRNKLKTYQKVLIFIFIALFIIATIILCVLFRQYIFTENALAYTLAIILILVCVLGFILYKVISNK